MKGNVPACVGTGLRQFAGILSVTDLSGNNIATFSSGAAIIGSTISNTVIDLIGDTIINVQNTVVLPSTGGGAALTIANTAATNQQSYIDFLYGVAGVVGGRLRSDGGGNMIYSVNGGIHQFRVGGDGGAPGSLEALRIATDGETLLTDLAGGLFRAGYMGFPANPRNQSYITLQSDAGKNVQQTVVGDLALTLGLTNLYTTGTCIMLSTSAAVGSRWIVSSSGSEPIYGQSGLNSSRTISGFGTMIVMKQGPGVWYVVAGNNYAPL